jgi:transcriptional regulator with XRE-family HTH domain
MPGPPPDPKKMAQALHLRRTRPELSLREIAEEIGVKSPTTVSNYIDLAERHEVWIPVANRAAIGARWDLVAGTVLDRLLARLEDPDAELEKTARAIADYLGLIAKRHGLFAPTKTENSTADAPPAPSSEMTLAIHEALAELDAADRKRELGSGS